MKTLSLILLLSLSLGASGVELASFPRCAGPDVPVGVLVTSYGAPVFPGEYSPRSVTLVRNGNASKPFSTLARLLSWRCRRTAWLRSDGCRWVRIMWTFSTGTPMKSSEQCSSRSTRPGRSTSRCRHAAGSPLACGPAALTVIGGGFQSAVLGTAFSDPVEIRVTDGQLRPVPFAELDLQYLRSAVQLRFRSFYGTAGRAWHSTRDHGQYRCRTRDRDRGYCCRHLSIRRNDRTRRVRDAYLLHVAQSGGDRARC